MIGSDMPCSGEQLAKEMRSVWLVNWFFKYYIFLFSNVLEGRKRLEKTLIMLPTKAAIQQHSRIKVLQKFKKVYVLYLLFSEAVTWGYSLEQLYWASLGVFCSRSPLENLQEWLKFSYNFWEIFMVHFFYKTQLGDYFWWSIYSSPLFTNNPVLQYRNAF